MGILTRRNIRKARGLYPRPPCDCREVFSCGEGLPRQAVAQPTDKRHSRPSGASSVVKGENEIRACSPDRVFVMKNRTFVEFISKIRAAWLFLHIANKKLIPMRIKSRTSGLMQTPREISHTGNPTGGAGAHSAVLPAAHEATDNPDNIFYRTIRTAMKKQLINLYIYWHRRACWPPDAPRKTRRTRRGTAPWPTRRSTRLRPRLQARPKRPQPGLSRSR